MPQLLGLIVLITLLVTAYNTIFHPDNSTKAQRQQNTICRALGRDGANAKTQAEYDFAKAKFVENCEGWKDTE